jgi:hypothetical protein
MNGEQVTSKGYGEERFLTAVNSLDIFRGIEENKDILH